MALHIKIFSGMDSMLDTIAKAHYGQGLDALDHAGIKLREAQRAALRSSTTPITRFYDRKGKLRIKRQKQELGKRISHVNKSNTDSPPSMENFITSNLMPNRMMMVVGGKHSTLHPKIRRDGRVEKNAETVKPVSKFSYAILQKLNSGDASSPIYQKIYKNKVEEKAFKNTNFRKQNFIEKGYSNAKGEVEDIMTRKLEQMIHKQINRAEVETREVRRA